ncbi:MAG: hypothetical protein HY556_11400 [Euryarchaeota archaeon]|nr:hypothetical protein [Euryarchaeota archaeon]
MTKTASFRNFGFVIALGAAALALAGCVNNDPAESQSVVPSSGMASSSSTDGVKRFDVNITEKGFRVHDGKELRVKQGDNVSIVFHHAEPFGDDHPIYFTCTDRAATVTATSGTATMAFVAKKAGTCAFFCTNGDCGPHKNLQDGKLIVEA